jgi:hypothetical protein
MVQAISTFGTRLQWTERIPRFRAWPIQRNFFLWNPLPLESLSSGPTCGLAFHRRNRRVLLLTFFLDHAHAAPALSRSTVSSRLTRVSEPFAYWSIAPSVLRHSDTHDIHEIERPIGLNHGKLSSVFKDGRKILFVFVLSPSESACCAWLGPRPFNIKPKGRRHERHQSRANPLAPGT